MLVVAGVLLIVSLDGFFFLLDLTRETTYKFFFFLFFSQLLRYTEQNRSVILDRLSGADRID